MDQSRRRFLKQSAILTGVCALMPSLNAQATGEIHGGSASYTLVKKAWESANLPHPLHYLKQAGLLDMGADIQVASRTDFLAGRTLTVDGLILSCAEASFLLCSAEGFDYVL